MLAHNIVRLQHPRRVFLTASASRRVALGLALLLCMLAGPAVAQDPPDESDDRLQAQVEAFALAYQQGRYDDAAALGELALALSREAFGDDPSRTGFLMLNLAKAHLRRGALDDAATMFAQARALFAGALGEAAPAVFEADLGLAALAEVTDAARASVIYASVVGRMMGVAELDPVMIANAQVGLARSLRQAGEVAEARAAYGSAVQVLERSLGAHHPATAQARAAWAALLGSPWVTADTLTQSWRTLRAALDDGHPDVVRLGVAAARALLDVGLSLEALEVALPVAASAAAGPETNEDRVAALTIVEEAWRASRDPAAMVQAIRSASPDENAASTEKEVAAARLAITLVRVGRAVDAVLPIDRARRLLGSSGVADPNLAEALARIGDPAQQVGASAYAPDLLEEAASIVGRLDPDHPRRGEVDGLIALAAARLALVNGDAAEAQRLARAALDRLTDADDPRGVLRLRIRAAQAAAFLGSSDERLAAVAFNGLERDVESAPVSAADLARGNAETLLTPDEAVTVLEYCSAFWRARGSADRVARIEAEIARWRSVADAWPISAGADEIEPEN